MLQSIDLVHEDFSPVRVGDEREGRLYVSRPRAFNEPLRSGGTINLSWGAEAPVGSSMDVIMRVAARSGWSKWFHHSLWTRYNVDNLQRTSYDEQTGPFGEILVDTYENTSRRSLHQWQTGVVCRGAARLWWMNIQIAHSQQWSRTSRPLGGGVSPLGVPVQSQYRYEGGESWCGAVSALGILEYFGVAPGKGLADVVEGVYDLGYNGTGNWSFLAAYLSTRLQPIRKRAIVQVVSSVREIEEKYLQRGHPVIASLKWNNTSVRAADHLDGGIDQTGGHLLVVEGTQERRVLTKDPATTKDENHTNVARAYRRDQFEERLIESSNGSIIAITDLP